MSKLAVSRYFVPSEADRRATRAKIELVRQMLLKTIALREALERFEDIEGEDLRTTLARYERAIAEQSWDAFADDYNRLYDQLPHLERRLEAALAEARGRRLRLELTAQTLLAGAESVEEKNALAAIIRSAPGVRAGNLDALQADITAILTARFQAAEAVAPSVSTGPQIELARALMSNAFPEREQLATTGGDLFGGDPSNPGRERINRLVAHLAMLDEDVAGYIDRARVIGAEPNAQRCALQMDSLNIEVAERVAAQRRGRDLDRLVGEALAELAPWTDERAGAFRAALNAAQGRGDCETARAEAEAARAWAHEQAKRYDALKARAAIVEGLKELGYEVRLQSDHWDEGQRIQAHKPNEPNYDVQLAAAANGSVQSKVQAYAHAGRSGGVNLRDVEVEQSWCNDLRKLHEKLAAQGIQGEIVQEEGPGSKAQAPITRDDASLRSGVSTKGQQRLKS